MKEGAARSSAFLAELRLRAAARAAACRVRHSRTRSAAQVCEWRRLSGWEILRGLGKPPRSPTRGRDKPICGAKRRRGSLRRRPLGGKLRFGVGKDFWGSSARRAVLPLRAAARAAACRVRRSRTRSAAQVCEWRRLSGWEILRGLGKPSECSKVDFTRMRHPPEGASPALCYAKR